MSDYGEPLSPKGPGTLVRAKKGAVPLRQEIQDKVDELTRHSAEIETVDRDLDDAMKGLDQSLKELEGRIKREFTEMSTKLEDVMSARCHELVGLAKSHFEKLNAIMAQQREALGEEGHRVKACIEMKVVVMSLFLVAAASAFPTKGNDDMRVLQAAEKNTIAVATKVSNALADTLHDMRSDEKSGQHNLVKDIERVHTKAQDVPKVLNAEKKATDAVAASNPDSKVLKVKAGEESAYTDLKKQSAKLTSSLQNHLKDLKAEPTKHSTGNWIHKEEHEISKMRSDLHVMLKTEKKALQMA